MNIDTLRSEIEALDAEIRSLHQTEEGELREFSPEDQESFDAKQAGRAKKFALLERHEAIEKAAALPERTVAPSAPNVITTRDALEVMEDRSSTPKQLADAALRELEGRDVEADNMAHVQKVVRAHARD